MTNLVQLGKHLTFKNGKSSPERANHLPYPVYGSNGLIGYADQSNTEANTLIIGRVGSYCGSVHFSKSPCWVTDNAIICRAIKEEDVFFWYSILSKYDLNRHSAGSGQPLLNQSILKSISLHLVNEEKWAAIGSFLSKIYDKIELNRQMNETLEEMARSTFKSWFVDFDPVVAKAAGQAPAHMSAQTADLFPDTFDENGLPQNWTDGVVSDAFHINPRESLKKGTISAYIDMASLPTSGSSINQVQYREFNSGTKFRNGDTLLARITPCLENGKSAYVDCLNDDELAWGSTEFIVLRSKGTYPNPLGYLLARDPVFRSYAIRHMSGTSGRQRVQGEAIGRYPLAIAPENILLEFDRFCAPLFAKIKANHEQNQTLADLRDTLLPKLMSGEIRLRDAEKSVEDA